MTIVPNWVANKLRGHESVIGSSRRLAEIGKLTPSDVQQIVLDVTAPIDLRADALTLFSAAEGDGNQTLRALLESTDKLVMVEALKRIREFSPEWAASEIIARVKNSNDPSERAVLAWTLAGYPENVEVRGALLELIKRDSDVKVRNHALESLGAFRSPVVVNALLNVLEHGSANERFWSLYSLGTIGDDRAVEAISRCLQDHTQIPDFGSISAEAKWALESIAKRTQDGPI
jgi:hypothetical protein